MAPKRPQSAGSFHHVSFSVGAASLVASLTGSLVVRRRRWMAFERKVAFVENLVIALVAIIVDVAVVFVWIKALELQFRAEALAYGGKDSESFVQGQRRGEAELKCSASLQSSAGVWC